MPYFLEIIEARDIVLFVFLLAILFASVLTARYLRRRADRKDNDFMALLVEHLNGPIEIILLLGAAYTVLKYLPYEWTEVALASRILAMATIFAAAWLAVRSVRFAAAFLMTKYDITQRNNLNARMVHTQIRVIRRFITTIIVLVAIASALMVFEEIRALGVSLLASAGVAGIVVGLAAQKTLGNFFTGLQIAFTQPIRIDDAVVVEGEWGSIEEINLTYVVVKIWDQRRLILPISYFVEQPFQNWTRTTADILGTVMLYLDYTMPVEVIRQELDRIIEDTDLWDGRVKVVQVTDTTDKCMVIRILVSAGDAGTVWNLRCLVREKMIAFIQENYPEQLPRFRCELPGAPGDDKEAA